MHFRVVFSVYSSKIKRRMHFSYCVIKVPFLFRLFFYYFNRTRCYTNDNSSHVRSITSINDVYNMKQTIITLHILLRPSTHQSFRRKAHSYTGTNILGIRKQIHNISKNRGIFHIKCDSCVYFQLICSKATFHATSFTSISSNRITSIATIINKGRQMCLPPSTYWNEPKYN